MKIIYIFSVNNTGAFSDVGKALFFWLVVHREQRNRQAIRKYTEGGGVASVSRHKTII